MGGEDAGEGMWGEGGCGSLRKQEERHCSEEDAVRGFDYFILFIWLFWVLVAARGIFSLRCGMWDLVPDQDGTRSPCIGSMES